MRVPENTGHFVFPVVTFPLAVKQGGILPHIISMKVPQVLRGNGQLHYNLLEKTHLSFQFVILYRSFKDNKLCIILGNVLCSKFGNARACLRWLLPWYKPIIAFIPQLVMGAGGVGGWGGGGEEGRKEISLAPLPRCQSKNRRRVSEARSSFSLDEGCSN